MSTLEGWYASHPVAPEMLWKEASRTQFNIWSAMEAEFGPASVVAEHRSKSIALPVVRFACERGYVLLRDNFHDIEMCVRWKSAPALTHRDVYGEPRTWDWYLEEIERARKYSGALSVANALHDPSWYWRNWSSGRLFFDGAMGPGVRIYRAERCYLQGIETVTTPEETELWEPGRSSFAVNLLNIDIAVTLMRRLWWPA